MSKKKSKTKNKQQREIDSNNFVDFFSTNTIIVVILLAIAIIARVSWIHSQSPVELDRDISVVMGKSYYVTVDE